MPHDQVGLDAVGREQPRQREVCRDHRRLGDLVAKQSPSEPVDGGHIVPVDEQGIGERLTEPRGHDAVDFGERVRNDGLARSQLGKHVDVLRALARVEEGRRGRRTSAQEDAARGQCPPHGRHAGTQRGCGEARLLGQLGGVPVVDGEPDGRC